MRTFFAFVSFFTLVCAESFLVNVGQDGKLIYDPPTVTAKKGDTVAFRFVSKNHTVTQSSFAKPCERLTTPALGVDSGYLPVPAGATSFPEWSFTIEDDTSPLWFYCAQARHCQAGMVFALNPTAEKTFDAFKATAMGASAPAAGSSSATAPSSTGSTSPPSGTTAAGGSSNTNQNGALTKGTIGRGAISVAVLLMGIGSLV